MEENNCLYDSHAYLRGATLSNIISNFIFFILINDENKMKAEVGKAIWTTMFACASTADSVQKRICFRNMIMSLFCCFPCEECSLHFDYLIKTIDIDLYTSRQCTKEDCLEYVQCLYNKIEELLEKEGKKKAKYISWNDVKSKWLSECEECKI